MTETKTYPTPAADELAVEEENLRARVDVDKGAREVNLSRYTHDELRQAYEDRYDRPAKVSDTKRELIARIVFADIEGLPGKQQGSPAAERLKRLTQAARAEEFILYGIRSHTVAAADARYQARLAEPGNDITVPELLADHAAAWQHDRDHATAWAFIGKVIEQGHTPIEAARVALTYFTNELVQRARMGTHSGSLVRTLLNEQTASAFAKFVDSIALYVMED